MRIGIDIDDTITNTWQTLIPIYSKKFNLPIESLTKSLPYYNAIKEYISIEEYFKLMNSLEDVLKKVPIKEYVTDILTKLKEEGNTIIFITARGKAYNNPYETAKEYLDRYLIPYDKIIVNVWDKGTVCKEEQIDLFIDDSIKHCKEVSDNGIEVIMMEANYNKDEKEFVHMKDWNQIYEYIKNR